MADLSFLSWPWVKASSKTVLVLIQGRFSHGSYIFTSGVFLQYKLYKLYARLAQLATCPRRRFYPQSIMFDYLGPKTVFTIPATEMRCFHDRRLRTDLQNWGLKIENPELRIVEDRSRACLAYLIIVTGTTGAARVKISVRCKFFQIERQKLHIWLFWG